MISWLSDDIKEFSNKMLDAAKLNLVTNGYVAPVMFLLMPNKQLVIIGLRFGNSEEKRAVYSAIERQIAENKPEGVIMINECWMKATNSDDLETVKRMEEHGVRAEADKSEAITMIVSPVSSTDSFTIQRFHKDEGKIVFDGKPETSLTEFENRLLPPQWKLRKTAREAVVN